MKRPAEYYTIWNQAVEAVELYLASNPRDLTLAQIETLFSYVAMDFKNAIVKIDTAGSDAQRVVEQRLDDLLSQDPRL